MKHQVTWTPSCGRATSASFHRGKYVAGLAWLGRRGKACQTSMPCYALLLYAVELRTDDLEGSRHKKPTWANSFSKCFFTMIPMQKASDYFQGIYAYTHINDIEYFDKYVIICFEKSVFGMSFSFCHFSAFRCFAAAPSCVTLNCNGRFHRPVCRNNPQPSFF